MVNQLRITVKGDSNTIKSDKSDCYRQIVPSCHSRVRGNLMSHVVLTTNDWIPACAGMTIYRFC